MRQDGGFPELTNDQQMRNVIRVLVGIVRDEAKNVALNLSVNLPDGIRPGVDVEQEMMIVMLSFIALFAKRNLSDEDGSIGDIFRAYYSEYQRGVSDWSEEEVQAFLALSAQRRSTYLEKAGKKKDTFLNSVAKELLKHICISSESVPTAIAIVMAGIETLHRNAHEMTTPRRQGESQQMVAEGYPMKDSREGQNPLNALIQQVESLINTVDVANVLSAVVVVCRKKAAGFREVPGENWIAGVNAAAWTRQAEIIERTVKRLEKENLT